MVNRSYKIENIQPNPPPPKKNVVPARTMPFPLSYSTKNIDLKPFRCLSNY